MIGQKGGLLKATGGGGSSGTVTSISVVTANGISGIITNPTTTPAITLATTITGILKGNGTSISAAINSDLPVMTSTIGGAVPTPPNNTTTFLRGDGTFAIPSGSTGTVTSVSIVTNQGVSGTVATSTTTPAITLSLGALTGVTSYNGLVVTANTGVITTGTWNASLIGSTFGGTGVNNNGSTITLGGSLTTSGAFTTTFTTTGNTNITLPTSGTLIAGTGTNTQVSVWTGTNIQSSYSTFIYNNTSNFLGIGGTPTATLHLSGNVSASNWGTTGINFITTASTYTNTTSSGTVANLAINSIGIPTLVATTATIFTNAYTLYLAGNPTSSTNVTQTNSYTLGVNGSVNITNGGLGMTGNLTHTGGTFFLGTSDGNTLSLTTSAVNRLNISSIGLQTHTFTAQSSGTTPFITWTQSANTGGSAGIFLITAGAHTSQTTATEIIDVKYDLSPVLKSVDGTIALQRAFQILGRTYTPQTSALTITTAATLDITSSIAGSGTTITNNFAIRSNGSIVLSTAGNGLYIKEGTNATMGTGTLVGGALVISTTKITANSRVFLTDSGGTITNLGTLYVSTRTAGTSFTVSSSNPLDTSNFVWFILEPAP